MAKSGRRAHPRRAGVSRPAPRREAASRRSNSPARRDPGDSRTLLERILDTPRVAQIVPHLRPEVLHRVIQSCGLEDCAEFVALATPGQLARVFDLDLWHARRPGLDEELDAGRFGVWLDVLMESGSAVAAEKLAGIDADVVVAALAQHVLVFDRAAKSPSGPGDDEPIESDSRHDALECEVGSYLVEARRTDAWDTIVAVLLALDAEHPDYFHRVMSGCRRLSHSGFEDDGLHDLLGDREQDMFDLATDRETRREKQGYATPAQARAFLHMARQLELAHETMPPANPLARAYLRAIDRMPADDADAEHGSSRLLTTSESPTDAAENSEATAAIMEVLIDAGVLAQPPRALLEGPREEARRLARIHAHLQFARETDLAAYAMRTEELAYLANTVMAGGTVQARPFTPREASDAAAAVCNLGLENWPAHWRAEKTNRIASALDRGAALPEGFLVDHDLISVFQVGWTVLHGDVCQYAAQRLIQVLADLRHDDREIQTGLDALRVAMARHWRAGAPWLARDALDVLVMLDMPAWAALLGFIAECPVLHAAVAASRGSGTRAVSPSAFEFISDNSQIASVHEFMRTLPDVLSGRR
jgi:uncharacterized protein DUF6178